MDIREKGPGAERSKSFHGRLLREYVRTKQVGEGDKLVPFPCQTADGRPFDWKTTRGKAVLLLYGGLDCMGPQGREALQALYDAASRDEWLVIVYQKVSAPEQMQPLKQRFRDAYIYVTDGKEEASPMCIRYGAQATPTCFLTDKKHRVRLKTVGFSPEQMRPFMNVKKEEEWNNPMK